MYVRNRYEAYNAKLLEFQDSPTEVKLEEINNFFNDVPYADKRKDLTPIYNFNKESLYHVKKEGQNGQKVTNIIYNKRVHKQWDKLIKNIKRNKL